MLYFMKKGIKLKDKYFRCISPQLNDIYIDIEEHIYVCD